MIEGVFGRIEAGCVVGWAFDTENGDHVTIKVKLNDKVIARGKADQERPDLSSLAKSQEGKVGFHIKLPKGRKNWNNIKVYANGTRLEKSTHLQKAIEKTTRTLTLEMEDPYFFIHIPKTAGTAFKKLLEQQFEVDEIFPSSTFVKQNRGLYPHFPQLLKLDPPKEIPKVLLGHYPLVTYRIISGKPKLIVILREPIQRVISHIFHIKNNDPRMKDMTPAQIYHKSRWSYSNFQIRYLMDSQIHPNMRFIDSRLLSKSDLQQSIANMRKCHLVGISESMEKTVALSNQMFGWRLPKPKRVNVAKSNKEISEKLLSQITKDNQLDQKLYLQAVNRFDKLCARYEVV